ncbi:MAG: DEAD/DEAH box helicase [Acidobacteria bacterium]|nr:DEAD/DEAH box helicase [Acidobacteriota bacterium]
MSLNCFHPIIRQWFADRIGTPTAIQNKAWPLIQEGRHVLVTAPTGCGKTLTAFLWALHQLISGEWEAGQTRVLYVSPLKALNNDIQRNLLTPLKELQDFFAARDTPMPEIRALTRSGDTPSHERQKMRRRPPEILITTPESLNILLTSKNALPLLAGIQTVILDEIHAMVDNKRGTHLITAVDRLVPLAGEFQRIALSATVKPLDLVARFVGGYRQTGPETYAPRSVTTVASGETKTYDLQVYFPEDAREKMTEDSWWPGLIDHFRAVLRNSRSTLLFANSRRLVEKVARLVNELEQEVLVYAHHGSLSREIRLAVEQKLKQGALRGIVATNSLELGIDIGSLDTVLMIQTPFSVSSTIQRLGRAGHRVGEVSRGSIVPTHGSDFLAAAVMARAVLEEDIEEVVPIRGPLDVLTQVILSACVTRVWDIDALYAFVRTSFPFHELKRSHYDLVLQMLEGRYADTRLRELKPRVAIDRIENTIKARDTSAFLLFMAGGTIPDRGYYDLRMQDTRAKVGELDEEFVWERKIGDTFGLGNRIWRIQRITHNDVEVRPETRQLNIIPFWKAESRDSGYHFAAKVGAFLEWANERLNDPGFKPTLRQDYHMTRAAADELTSYLERQRDISGTDLPHRHHILIEQFQDPGNRQDARQVILHTFWGGRVNRPFAMALAMAWEEIHGHPLQVFVNNDAVLLMLPSECSARTLMSLLTPENVEAYLTRKLEQTGTFGAHFRENAGRALLLPKQSFKKRMPLWLNRLRSKKLLQSIQRFEDFPILLETWRTCLQDAFDLPNLKACLDAVHTQQVRFTTVKTERPSPFADGLIWRQTNQFMYEDDTPLASQKVSLKSDLLRDLLFASQLRPRIPAALIRELEAKRQGLYPGYAPDNDEDLLQHVKDRMLIPMDEWIRLNEAVPDDGEIREITAPKLAKVQWKPAKHAFVTARENIPRLHTLFGDTFSFTDLSGKRIPYPKITTSDEEETAIRMEPLLGQWLSFYGPMPPERLCELFGLSSARCREAVEALLDDGQIVLDTLSEGAAKPQICDITNLEILLRWVRRSHKPSFQIWPIADLPLFLASYQGLTRPGRSPEDLQAVLNQLFGLPLSPQLWEEVVFPCRLSPYFSPWLDRLVQEHNLLLLGHRDKKLSILFPEDLDLFPVISDPAASAVPLLVDVSGRFSFQDLVEKTSLAGSELTERLWQAFWQGRISTDAFAALRMGMASKFRPYTPAPRSKPRPGRPRGFGRGASSRWSSERAFPGNWRAITHPESTEDPIQAEELNKDRVRQLLSRYGILFRELLQREQPQLQWRSVFRTLRLMEFSGEVLAGPFFEGIPGLQFMSHEAFALLNQDLDRDRIFWLNACDPASLCGTGIEGFRQDLPARLPSNFVVYHGANIALVVQKYGKSLDFRVDPGHARMPEILAIFKTLLERDFNPRKRITIETINKEPALHSSYRDDLIKFGFVKIVDSLELWRQYNLR